ncbi:MAG: nucleoside triphosphate pyrophosphohydrolase [Oscillospiraceae bacterium]
MISFDVKDNYNIEDLLHIVELLRNPDGGCPWDKEQTHKSIKMNFIEETYEVADAIELEDKHLLCEELGDILLQVALHTEMEREVGGFTFDEVCDGICKKLIYRHPHVFGDTVAANSKEVLATWEKLKQSEKGRDTAQNNLESVPKHFPALMRAEKLGKRAGTYGYDFQDVNFALDALDGEIAELRCAIQANDANNIASELGDVLFSAVNVGRKLKVNSEQALTLANDKFVSRVTKAEQIAAAKGEKLKELDAAQLDELWNKAKAETNCIGDALN